MKRNRYRPNRARQKALALAWIKGMLGLPAGVAAVLLFSAFLAHSYRVVLDLPWLSIEEIETVGLKRLQRDDLLRHAGLARPTSILQVRTAVVARRLEAHPWIQAALVRIDPPRRVVLEIEEREPMAVVHKQGFFLMDTQGRLFLEVRPEYYQQFPLFTGFADTQLALGSALPEHTLKTLSSLIAALEQFKDWLPPADLSEIRWQNGDGVTLYTTRGAIPIHLGSDHFVEKLKRLQTVQKVISERRWWDTVQTIDLDYPRQAYIKGIPTHSKGI
jgi:cell division septal protein FtsQ